MCLVGGGGGGGGKWKDGKLFCLVKKKNERIENVDCINLLSYP